MRVLHAGCGADPLPAWLSPATETRLDISPACNPDIVASFTDMGQIGPFDAVVCQHALEHLTPEQVPQALSEFRRVLHSPGFVYIVVPDTENVEPTDTVLFESPAGPITGWDLHYGWRPALAEHPYMAHHTRFMAKTLESALISAGFDRIAVRKVAPYNLLAAGVKL